MSVPDPNPMTPGAIAASPERMRRLFDGAEDVLPLWIAEPYLGLAPEIETALQERAAAGWYGYEVRPETTLGAFWSWMGTRHGWDGAELSTTVSPSVGTSIGVLIDRFTEPGQGVILQPPVFTDFKPLINRAGRTVVRNGLQLTEAGYRMDLDDLAANASDPENRLMILCNPHNPVGRVWSSEELSSVARICAEYDVVVVADEIHADLALPGSRFTPFARAAGGSGVAWAALHGPIKTFGLAGVCDTLLITDNTSIADAFRTESSRLHLTRNNVFNIAALEAAYTTDGSWLDGLLEQVAANVTLLRNGLPDGIGLIPPEGTYLAWLDFRRLGMDVPELAAWLASSAKLALSPGHWFGREGAGFARMTIAAPTRWIEEAVARVGRAVRRRPG